MWSLASSISKVLYLFWAWSLMRILPHFEESFFIVVIFITSLRHLLRIFFEKLVVLNVIFIVELGHFWEIVVLNVIFIVDLGHFWESVVLNVIFIDLGHFFEKSLFWMWSSWTWINFYHLFLGSLFWEWPPHPRALFNIKHYSVKIIMNLNIK